MTPPPLRIEHRCRASVLEKETLWRLEGDTLLKIVEGLPPFSIPLHSIVRICLEYAPTQYLKQRCLCRLDDSRGVSASFPSGHYVDFAAFEDRSASYRPFVLELIRRRAAYGPGCRYLAGTSFANWLLQSTVLAGGLAILTTVLWHLSSAVNDWTWERILIVLGMIPAGLLWLASNRPREFDPARVPQELLPPKPELS